MHGYGQQGSDYSTILPTNKDSGLENLKILLPTAPKVPQYLRPSIITNSWFDGFSVEEYNNPMI